MSASPEVKSLSISYLRVFRAVEANHEDEKCLSASIKYPDPELLQIEDGVLHANAVEDGCTHEDILLELEVKECVPDVVQASERHVVDLVDPLFIHGLAGEDGEVAEHELNHDVEDVLVEHE